MNIYYFISKLFAFVSLKQIALNSGIGATVTAAQCKDFAAIFLWHTGMGENYSFILQRRLLVSLIKELPENTSVFIMTLGTKNDKRFMTTFWKQEEKRILMDEIMSYKPGNASNNIISGAEIRHAVSDHTRSKKLGVADIVYILVDNTIEILDTEDDIEELRKKKTFILSSGKLSTLETNIWLKIATNEHHFVNFNRDKDVISSVEDVMVLSCKDSFFVCDTDMFWLAENGTCKTCMYICASSCKEQPEFCTRACPYYQQFEQDELITKDTAYRSKPFHENISSTVFVNSGLTFIICLTIIAFFVISKNRRRLLRCINSFRRRQNGCLEGRTDVEDNNSPGRTYLFEESNDNERENFGGSNREISVDNVSDIQLKVLS